LGTRAFKTIQISSRVLAHGELVELLGNGEALVRDGSKLYRGRPVELGLGSTPIRPGDAATAASGARA